MNLCYTAIIGPYERLKNPTVITPGWKYRCYTDQNIISDVWEIINVPHINLHNPRHAARFYKIIASTGAIRSIWVDGSFQVNVNLNDWWGKHFKSPMTCIKHPIRDCVYEEADAVIKNNRGGSENVLSYIKKINVHPHSGLIQSGIIMREHTKEVGQFCRLWWNETINCLRDQITFAVIANKFPLPIHYIKYDYRSGSEFLFTSHYKKQTHAV